MQLANITLKVNSLGSSVDLQNVTPPELMFLVADNHKGAGGNPIVKMEVLDDKFEDEPITKIRAELKDVEKRLADLDELEIADEVREARTRRFRDIIKVKTDRINELLFLKKRRAHNPATERAFLGLRYGAKRMKSFFPGSIPQMPTTFEEAQQAGIGADVPTQRLLDHGDTE